MGDLRQLVLDTPFEPLARRLFIHLGSESDRLTLAIMRRCLRADSNCLDIGAHRGTILAEIVRLAPSGRHHAFEPIPRHSRYLAKTFPTVQVHALALSNVRHETDFLHDRRHPTRSCFYWPGGDSDGQQVIRVETDLLDNLVPATQRVDFIKIDVEGAELDVLQGAASILRAQRPVVVLEHARQARNRYGAPPERLHDFLDQCGMRISAMKAWLAGEPSLGRGVFAEEVNEGRSTYFVAHR